MPITPFGIGSLTGVTAPPVSTLQAAYINPKTKDYVTGDDGELAGMPPVRQQMLLAVTTIQNSSSVDPSAGINVPRKVDEKIGEKMRQAVERACSHITSAGRARITDVTTEHRQLGVRTTISYDDLTLGKRDTVGFVLRNT